MNKKIKTKIHKTVIKVLLMSMLFLGVAFAVVSFYTLMITIGHLAKETSQQLAEQLTVPVLFQDHTAIESELKVFTAREAVTSIHVYLNTSDYFYSYGTSDRTEHSHRFAEQFSSCPKEPFFSYFFIECIDITDEGKRIAHLVIEFTQKPLMGQLITQLFIFLISLIFAYSLGLYYADNLSYILTLPLVNLAVTAKKVIKYHDYSQRATVSSDDEVAIITKVFNQMLQEIELRDRQLNNYANDLENKIKERTISLQYAVTEAIEANKSKSEFLANMSHELRTPLHGILSFAQLGNQRYQSVPTEKLGEYFHNIHISGHRLLELLNDLLDISKLEANKMELYMEVGDLRQVANQCIREQEARLESKGLSIVWSSDNTNTGAIFDSQRIFQVINNILSNAIKFSSKNSIINLKFSDTELNKKAAIQSEISNIGIGIPECELEKVFDKFIQSTKTNTGAGGSGLGLAICKKIIHCHHGQIWAESPSENEVSFSFVLPREPDE